MEFILASKSPRRKQILEDTFGLKPLLLVAGIEENVPVGISPGDLVLKLAEEKGFPIGNFHPDSVVISGDTVVALDRKILGKPKDEAEARKMLMDLSGQHHHVYTGHSIHYKGHNALGLSISEVVFD